MTTETRERNIAWLTLVISAWLFLSGWILGFADVATPFWNNLIVGGALVLLALGAMGNRNVSWVNVILGAWVFLSPFILGFGGLAAAMVNNLVVGALVMIIAWTNARQGGTQQTAT